MVQMKVGQKECSKAELLVDMWVGCSVDRKELQLVEQKAAKMAYMMVGLKAAT